MMKPTNTEFQLQEINKLKITWQTTIYISPYVHEKPVKSWESKETNGKMD